MSKKTMFSVAVLASCFFLPALAACGKSASSAQTISVVSREEGSGTRGAFVELFGIEEEKDGEKVDLITSSAIVTNSTAVMLTTVAGDEQAIGYTSLGALDDSVKAVSIDGVKPSVANVENDSYKISRPFNIVTKAKVSDAAQDFISFIMSSDGQKVVEKDGYISVEASSAYKSSVDSGKVVVSGSSSVAPVMEKLKEAYAKVNANVKVEVQQSDSSTGVSATIDGTADIGMASRELKDSETSQGVTATVIAKDGIAVIVNKENDAKSLTSKQVKSIFTGDTTKWSDVSK